MPDHLRLVYPGSPLLPVFDHNGLVKRVIQDLIVGHQHAAAIAMATSPLMSIHASLLRQESSILTTQHITEADLQMLVLGYLYPLGTILASIVLRLQDQMLQDLRATINLLKMDPSGAMIFDFLKKYPFSNDEHFLNGMEIAAIIFFGVSLEVAKKTGDDYWLNVPIFDPNRLD